MFSRQLLREVFLNPGLCLLFGGIIIGFISGLQGPKVVQDGDAFFVHAFQGALCLFLLEMGMTASRKLRDLRSAGGPGPSTNAPSAAMGRGVLRPDLAAGRFSLLDFRLQLAASIDEFDNLARSWLGSTAASTGIPHRLREVRRARFICTTLAGCLGIMLNQAAASCSSASSR